LSKRFLTFPMLMEYILDYSKSHEFIISQKPKLHFNFNKENWPFDHPFKLVASRGWCLCSPKSQKCSLKSSCPYKIVYGWQKSTLSYHINQKASILTHNHALGDERPSFGDREHVSYESELTNDKWSYLKIQVLSKINGLNIHMNLERTFKARCYSNPLIYRVRNKMLDKFYGKDQAQLNSLFMKGDTICRLGRLFEVEPSSGFGISALHLQSSSMKKYARMYPLFRQGDGTHSLSGHPFVFVFSLTVNCLFMSQFVGTTASLARSSAPIIAGAKKIFDSSFPSSNEQLVESGKFPGMFNPWVDEADVIEDNDSFTLPPANMC